MRRRSVGSAALVVGLTATCAPFIGGSSARADATYQALAYSTGVKFIFSNQSIPLGVAPQVQGPTAQAKQTSLQQSDAYAAGPYPGEDIAGIPGVAGGALGVAAPAYPFVVSTAYGDDIKQVSYPGLELSSESGDSVTQASATGGSKGAGASSMARIAHTGEEISAVAGTDTDALRLGEDLIITGLHASADAERDATGKLTRTSSLTFSNISVPGLALTVPNPPGSAGGPPQKLTAPQLGFDNGTFTVTVPGAEPQSTPIPLDQVLAAFAQAGYQVTYQAPQETADGIIGAGLQFNTVLPAPPDGSPAGLSGTTPVTMSIGLAQAEISYGASQTTAGTAIGTAPPPAGAAALPVAPVAPLPAVGGDVPLPDAAPLPASAPAATVPTADITALTAVRTPLHSDEGWLMGVLAAVGLAVAAGAVLLIRGVRA